MRFFVISTLLFLSAGLFWYLVFSRREKRLFRRLQKMVDEAREGTFQREEISETKMSLLEDSLQHFLDERRAAGEDQQQKQLIQTLISDIAHQTLTPVSNLILYSELLDEQLAGSSKELKIIRDQTEKLNFLIQSLVKLSRMENGMISVKPVENGVGEFLEELRQEYQEQAARKDITLTVADCPFLTAVFDRKWIREAIGNLVDNGLKYTRPGGKVILSAKKYSFFVRIDVTDTGIGIRKEEINKIFGRFYRSLEVQEEKGVGIGLYLAREIIRIQKGYINRENCVLLVLIL